MRNDPGVVRNYGRLLTELAAVVPDGMVCFFVSYSVRLLHSLAALAAPQRDADGVRGATCGVQYMDTIVEQWNEMGVLQELLQHKLVFIETQVRPGG
jgi:DNA excision repair protein ERCC-2